MAESDKQPICTLSSNEEEVHRKPLQMTDLSDKQPINTDSQNKSAGISNYYDILVIGRTGMGKSSTVDKLMVLNTIPENVDLKPHNLEAPPNMEIQENAATTVHLGPQRQVTTIDRGQGVEDSESKTTYKNLTGWVLSEDPKEQMYGETRLKNIIFIRETTQEADSHIEIDQLRNDEEYQKGVYSSSKSCQLLTNDDSKIQVLDAPGFFSPDLLDGATNTGDSNLAIVRHIVRLQAIAGLRFQRILYFLPQTGPLKRSDRTMQEEIQQMVKFFGRSIFESMVLVATAPPYYSERKDESDDRKFPPKDLEKSRGYFHDTLVREFKEKKEDTTGLPIPPIIFIAMTHTCKEILGKIVSAPINSSSQGLRLEFNPQTCIRCGIERGITSDKKLICEYRSVGASLWTDAIAYEKSFCHPMIQPVYTAKSILSGIAKVFLFKWCFTEERCVNPQCKSSPGEKGCMQVGQLYKEEGYEPIRVDHSSKLDKKRVKVKAKVQAQAENTSVQR